MMMSAPAATAASTSQQALRLDLDRQAVVPFAHAADGFGDAAGDADVIVLDQHAVVQTEAMIRAAAAPDGVLRQRPQRRHRLARVENRDAAARGVDESPRQRGDPRQVLEEIERRSLGGQDARAEPVDLGEARARRDTRRRRRPGPEPSEPDRPAETSRARRPGRRRRTGASPGTRRAPRRSARHDRVARDVVARTILGERALDEVAVVRRGRGRPCAQGWRNSTRKSSPNPTAGLPGVVAGQHVARDRRPARRRAGPAVASAVTGTPNASFLSDRSRRMTAVTSEACTDTSRRGRVERAAKRFGDLGLGRPRRPMHRSVAPPRPDFLGDERQERREQSEHHVEREHATRQSPTPRPACLRSRRRLTCSM